jgi:predicted nucleotidyltransferase component of viral defense system
MMTRIIDILERFLDGLKDDNPFSLVLKGGTALAVHHLPKHRESEDLDFDAPAEFRSKNQEVVRYIKERFEKLKKDGVIKGYDIPKAVFASTDRFHMTVLLMTHVKYQTKIDLTYRSMPEQLEMEGQLRFYTKERMLVDKLLTFSSRGELKDIYDISLLLEKVDAGSFKERIKVAGLVQRAGVRCCAKDTLVDFRKEMQAADLRFRYLKESGVDSFLTRTVRNLRRFESELRKSG